MIVMCTRRTGVMYGHGGGFAGPPAVLWGGGVRTVPMACARRARKPHGYWKDVGNIRAEVDAFLAAAGTPAGHMPTAAQLRAAGRRDLLNAITNAGGFRAVADRIGRTSARHSRKEPGYWNDPENVKTEVLRFLDERPRADPDTTEPRCMPTLAELRAAGRTDLEQGIRRCGGFGAVAAALGLQQRSHRREAGYWRQFDRVEEAVRAFVAERDAAKPPDRDLADVEMPSQKELRDAGRADLAQAISEFHGGFSAVGKRLGYLRRTGDWSEFYMLAQELLRFTRTEMNNAPIMPTTTVLKKHKRSDLLSAITKHGGMAVVSEKLGLQYQIRTREVFRDWQFFRRSLVSFTQAHGTPGELPSSRELRNFGRLDLYQGILYWGGPRAVGERAFLRVGNYWQYFHYVGEQVLDFIDKHGTPGVMPAEADFLCVGNKTLEVAVAKFGYSQVAARLGLKETSGSPQKALTTLMDSLLKVDADGNPTDADDWEKDDPLSLSSLTLDEIDLKALRNIVDRRRD